MCILSLDLCSTDREWTERIQREAAARFGFPSEAVLVHAIQSHSSPSIGHYMPPSPYIPAEFDWLRGGDERYIEFCFERILRAMGRARAALEPVTVSYTSGIEGRVAFNRRYVMRDGKARMHPRSGDPRIRYAEGPVDPEVGVVCFTTEDLRTLAVLLHFTCHPCHGNARRYVSADWPGVWSDGMRAFCGPDCVPLTLNGFCGNIHHRNHLDAGQVDDYQSMGQALTETAITAIRRELTQIVEPRLDCKTEHLMLPYRDIEAELQQAREYLKHHPEPDVGG